MVRVRVADVDRVDVPQVRGVRLEWRTVEPGALKGPVGQPRVSEQTIARGFVDAARVRDEGYFHGEFQNTNAISSYPPSDLPRHATVPPNMPIRSASVSSPTGSVSDGSTPGT